MKVNQGFAPPAGRRTDLDKYPQPCGACHKPVPEIGAHIVCSPYGPDMHVMYCPEHCPCAGE